MLRNSIAGLLVLQQALSLLAIDLQVHAMIEPDTRATPIVEMRDIHKHFGGIKALDGVNLKVLPGEILGLVGDNSAGKSTLMKVLVGEYHKDQGQILFDGREVILRSPHDSRALGIEMVYQDLSMCGNMDVALNMFMGRWPTKGMFLDKKRMMNETREVLQRLRVDIASAKMKVAGLSGGRQQSLAIARAISFNPKVIILDEPTANLSVPAIARVLEIMTELKRLNIAQVIISHRLTDVFSVADRVAVLKRGRLVGERVIRDATEDEILGLVVRGEGNDEAPAV